MKLRKTVTARRNPREFDNHNMNYLVPDAAILDIVKKIIERSNWTLEVAENLFTGAGVGVKIKKRTQNTHIKYISNH